MRLYADDRQYWFVRDILEKNRHDDMPLEDRETSARMAIQSMNFFQDLWPKAKIWYMHMSMMNEDDLIVKKAREYSGDGMMLLANMPDGESFLEDKSKVDDPDAYPPMYTWRRQAQYRATMQTMIAAAGFDSLDVSFEVEAVCRHGLRLTFSVRANPVGHVAQRVQRPKRRYPPPGEREAHNGLDDLGQDEAPFGVRCVVMT
jgi:hypothetical protein